MDAWSYVGTHSRTSVRLTGGAIDDERYVAMLSRGIWRRVAVRIAAGEKGSRKVLPQNLHKHGLADNWNKGGVA